MNPGTMYFTSLVAVLVLATALLSAGEPTAVDARGRGAVRAVAAPAEPAPRAALASTIAALHSGYPEPEPDAATGLAP